MQRTIKPKNARSKRALKAREPRLVEGAKTAVFVRGSQTSEKVRVALSELQQLKAPNSILFSKRNVVHPFSDPSPLLFWSQKNDAPLFLHGSHSKKRPDNLTFVRLFDHQILDMVELGVEAARSMRDYPGIKVAPGLAPLFHFAGSLWDADARYGQVKNMFLDFFRGEQLKALDLVHGLQHAISVTVGDQDDTASQRTLLDGTTPTGLASAGPAHLQPTPAPITSIMGDSDPTSSSALPLIHFRTYTISLLRSGHKQPRVTLTPHGPSFDFRLRRCQSAPDELLKLSLRKAPVKTQAAKDRKGKNKNVDLDEMGDKVGRIHVGQQDLDKLQSRKMKGLKQQRDAHEGSDNEDAVKRLEEDEVSDLEMQEAGSDDDRGKAVSEVMGTVKRRRL